MLRSIITILLILAFIDFGNSANIDASYSLIVKKIYVKLQINKEILNYNKIMYDTVRLQYMTMHEFKETLGKYESTGIYNIENAYGFKGKYQFSNRMIERFTDLSPANFLADSIAQEVAMSNVCAFYITYLQRIGYFKYINKKIGNVDNITLEALLLGCHFSPTYLKQYLESNGKINKTDGYISIGKYMKRFECRGIETTIYSVKSN